LTLYRIYTKYSAGKRAFTNEQVTISDLDQRRYTLQPWMPAQGAPDPRLRLIAELLYNPVLKELIRWVLQAQPKPPTDDQTTEYTERTETTNSEIFFLNFSVFSVLSVVYLAFLQFCVL
jgi:hypothetical protein